MLTWRKKRKQQKNLLRKRLQSERDNFIFSENPGRAAGFLFVCAKRYTSSMQTTIKTTTGTLTDGMRLYIQEKIIHPASHALGSAHSAACHLDIEVGRITRHHRKGGVWRAEASLFLGKRNLRAEATGESFQETVDILESELVPEIKKFKGKGMALAHRNARNAKKNATIAKAARFHRKGRIREEGK